MSDGAGPTHLEQQIVLLCGLSKMLAPGLLRRALADVQAGTPPTPEDVLRALPMIETRMRAYLPPNEVRERSAQMRKLLAAGPASAQGDGRLVVSDTGEPSSSVRVSLPTNERPRDGRP
jgi:hypothetical protein